MGTKASGKRDNQKLKTVYRCRSIVFPVESAYSKAPKGFPSIESAVWKPFGAYYSVCCYQCAARKFSKFMAQDREIPENTRFSGILM